MTSKWRSRAPIMSRSRHRMIQKLHSMIIMSSEHNGSFACYGYLRFYMASKDRGLSINICFCLHKNIFYVKTAFLHDFNLLLCNNNYALKQLSTFLRKIHSPEVITTI